jgi:hypothetical protein
MNIDQIADRKALLVTRADLDRTRLSLATREVRMLVLPRRNAARSEAMRPKAAAFLALAVPFLGIKRLSRLVRVASYAMLAIRIASNWRRSPLSD